MDQANRQWKNEEIALYAGWKKHIQMLDVGEINPVYKEHHCWKTPENHFPMEPRFHESYEDMLKVVELIETQGFGVKMCRKVVEIYIDDTKEPIVYAKKENRKESLFDALQEFVFLSQTNENIRNFIKAQEKKNIDTKARSILKTWQDKGL